MFFDVLRIGGSDDAITAPSSQVAILRRGALFDDLPEQRCLSETVTARLGRGTEVGARRQCSGSQESWAWRIETSI